MGSREQLTEDSSDMGSRHLGWSQRRIERAHVADGPRRNFGASDQKATVRTLAGCQRATTSLWTTIVGSCAEDAQLEEPRGKCISQCPWRRRWTRTTTSPTRRVFLGSGSSSSPDPTASGDVEGRAPRSPGTASSTQAETTKPRVEFVHGNPRAPCGDLGQAAKNLKPEVSHVSNVQDWLDSQIPDDELREARTAELRQLIDFGAFKAIYSRGCHAQESGQGAAEYILSYTHHESGYDIRGAGLGKGVR